METLPCSRTGIPGQGTRLNPARNNGKKRCTACTRCTLCTRLSCNWVCVRACVVRVHGRELMCLMLMLSAGADRVSSRQIGGSARRLNGELSEPQSTCVCVRACVCDGCHDGDGCTHTSTKGFASATLVDCFINRKAPSIGLLLV